MYYSGKLFTQDTIPRNGLIAEYLLNGDAIDTAGANSGTLTNNPTLTTGRKGTNSALMFSKINKTAVTLSMSFFKQNICSVSLWFNSNANQSDSTGLFNFCLYSNDGGHLIVFIANKIAYYRKIRTGWLSFSSNSIITNNIWYHVVITFDGNIMRLYINNVLQTATITNSTPTDYGADNQPAQIGRYVFDAGCFNGAIDDVRVYNKAITQQEVTILYNE